MCEHFNFKANVKVARLSKEDGGPIRNYFADIAINCQDCGLPFHFIGLQAGLDFDRPTVNINGTELRAPIVQGAGPMQNNATFRMPEEY